MKIYPPAQVSSFDDKLLLALLAQHSQPSSGNQPPYSPSGSTAPPAALRLDHSALVDGPKMYSSLYSNITIITIMGACTMEVKRVHASNIYI